MFSDRKAGSSKTAECVQASDGNLLPGNKVLRACPTLVSRQHPSTSRGEGVVESSWEILPNNLRQAQSSQLRS